MEGNSKVLAFDLFCGAGGSSCGARQAGAQIVGGVDLWDKAAETFQLNFPNAIVYRRPLDKRFKAHAVAKEVGPIQLLLASPECTNHSVAKGSAPRDDKSRRTAFEVVRFARAWRPRWIVVENVVPMKKWHAYPEWLRKLQCLGYKTQEIVLNAHSFGVPQNRRRLFVVADLERKPIVPTPRRCQCRSVKSVIRWGTGGKGHSYRRSPLASKRRAKPTLERARRAVHKLGKNKPFLIVYYGSDGAGGWQSLDRPLRTITTRDRFALVVPNDDGHEMRMLQPPELAAATGFPKDYRWPAITRRDHIKLIGNAVSPPVMKAVVESLTS